MSDAHSASELVQRHSLLFGKSMIEAGIPNPIDGFKFVHRRILWAMRERTAAYKSQKMISEATELHPHGPDSIYNAAVRMAQVFEYNPPLIDFIGKCGTYASPLPASSRYTETRNSEFTVDVFFNKTTDLTALPKQLDELLLGYEPVYLVPCIPTALLYANNTIGYGDSSYTVSHSLTDVCDLTIAYAHHQKHHPTRPFDYAKHAEKFLPDFPVVGTLTNHQALLTAYRQGDFNHKIKLDGEVTLTSDSIHIRTLPYRKEFDKLLTLIEGFILEKNSWFDKNILWVKPASNELAIGDICVRLKRGTNVFEAWEQLRKRIAFSHTITPIPNYNDHGYVLPISPPNLLAMWFEVRYNILVSSKKIHITTLSRRMREVEALLIICDHIDAVVALIKANDTKTGIVKLQAAYALTEFQATYLVNAPLKTLSASSKAELQDRQARLNKEITDLRNSFTRIPEEIAAEATAIKKKYATPRRTKIPDYIGYVSLGGGCIQLDTVDEIADIIANFPKVEMEIHMYDGPHLYKVSENNKLERGSIPKITTGDIYGLKTNAVVTVNIVDGVACCVKGFIPGLRKEGYFYTTPRSRAIYRNGDIKVIEVTEEISLRKTISRGAATNIIYVYPDLKETHYVIALNTATPNVIFIQRVAADRSKLAMNPTGEVSVSHTTNKHTFLNIPAKYLNRLAIRVVEFLDIDQLLDGKDQVRLDLAAMKIKSNKFIRLL